MIVKMKFLSITGPKEDIDRVVNQYLSKYEIHMENALAQLTEVQHLSPYIQANPYRDALGKANDFVRSLGPEAEKEEPEPMSVEEALSLIQNLEERLLETDSRRAELEAQKADLEKELRTLTPFRGLPETMRVILNFRFIRCRFGRIGREFYSNFEQYVYDSVDTVFYKSYMDENFVWGVYFAPRTQIDKVDAVLSSMHFERLFISEQYDEYKGTPEDAYVELESKLKEVVRQVQECKNEAVGILHTEARKVISARECLNALSVNFDVRKVAACVKEKRDTFYVLCGWMAEKDALQFQKEVENDDRLFCIIEDDKNNIHCKPPTKLRNPKIFKPFEMFVRMYGLPDYREMDPTIFVAITYTFIFGAMFGDVGQGLCLAVGGFLLYHFKKMDLAAIIGTAGIFSTIFGFLFGSVFGFETLDPVWLRPMNAMMDVPFVGQLNTVFIVAIGFGMGLILLAMVFHIVNGIKARDPENIWFDTNALAGLVFYGSAAVAIVLMMTGHTMPGAIVLLLMFGVPLLLIFLKEPLTALVEKKKDKMEGGKVMFVVQGFFELFEVLLSYFSNTLSFVRIGAFAVSHAAMMSVVLTLAGAENGGSPNWLVVVLGNIFVCGLEGLIVGIQVLRLEYYEMFSRFYKGTGKEFVPFLYRSKIRGSGGTLNIQGKGKNRERENI